jgi:hypothetical protein
VDVAGDLERGRGAYADEAWAIAHESLAAADRARPLGAGDLEGLAVGEITHVRSGGKLGVLADAPGS